MVTRDPPHAQLLTTHNVAAPSVCASGYGCRMAALGELERCVMDAMWGHPPATVREVADRMRPDAERAYTTVMTTLDRLFKKGLLRREKVGLAWRYAEALPRAAYERRLADELAAELVNHGEVGLVALVDAAADPALLDRLSQLIEARRGST